MKRISLVLALLLAMQFVFAQTSNSVSEREAMVYGLNFVKAECPTRAEFVVSSHETIKSETTGKDCFHAFNFENGGFVIVCADRRGNPILGFSDEDAFDYENIAPATKAWIKQYIGQLDIIESDNAPLTQENLAKWDPSMKRSNVREVTSLIKTRWSQEYPYNMYCPEHSQGSNGRCYTGCVATAMAQLMKFWEYPTRGTGTASFFWGDWIEIDLSSVEYDWDNMPNELKVGPGATSETQNSAVATLMYHCGVSVNMDYGYDGSSSQTALAASALRSNFGYRSGLNFQYRDDGNDLLVESDRFWGRMLQEDLEMSRPILYSGQSPEEGGHAFICDGFKTDDEHGSYFHFNWGWGGSNNGYFWIDKYDWMDGTERINDFNVMQGAIFNTATPSAAFCNSTETNVYEEDFWTINDGSYANNYNKNTNCDWLINYHDIATDTLMYVFKYFELGEGDVLNLYKGESSAAPLLHSYRLGEEPTDTVYHVGTPIFMEFITDGSDQGRGWEMYYEAMRYDYTVTTTVAGVGGRITPSGTKSVRNGATVVVEMIPNPGYKVSEFTVDGVLTLGGAADDNTVGYTFTNIQANHTIEVTFEPAAIENENIANISVYPNPNNGKFTLNVEDNAISCMLYDMNGKVVREIAINGQNSVDFDMNLAAGTYFLRVITADKVAVEKIVIE